MIPINLSFGYVSKENGTNISTTKDNVRVKGGINEFGYIWWIWLKDKVDQEQSIVGIKCDCKNLEGNINLCLLNGSTVEQEVALTKGEESKTFEFKSIKSNNEPAICIRNSGSKYGIGEISNLFVITSAKSQKELFFSNPINFSYKALLNLYERMINKLSNNPLKIESKENKIRLLDKQTFPSIDLQNGNKHEDGTIISLSRDQVKLKGGSSEFGFIWWLWLKDQIDHDQNIVGIKCDFINLEGKISLCILNGSKIQQELPIGVDKESKTFKFLIPKSNKKPAICIRNCGSKYGIGEISNLFIITSAKSQKEILFSKPKKYLSKKTRGIFETKNKFTSSPKNSSKRNKGIFETKNKFTSSKKISRLINSSSPKDFILKFAEEFGFKFLKNKYYHLKNKLSNNPLKIESKENKIRLLDKQTFPSIDLQNGNKHENGTIISLSRDQVKLKGGSSEFGFIWWLWLKDQIDHDQNIVGIKCDFINLEGKISLCILNGSKIQQELPIGVDKESKTFKFLIPKSNKKPAICIRNCGSKYGIGEISNLFIITSAKSQKEILFSKPKKYLSKKTRGIFETKNKFTSSPKNSSKRNKGIFETKNKFTSSKKISRLINSSSPKDFILKFAEEFGFKFLIKKYHHLKHKR